MVRCRRRQRSPSVNPWPSSSTHGGVTVGGRQDEEDCLTLPKAGADELTDRMEQKAPLAVELRDVLTLGGRPEDGLPSRAIPERRRRVPAHTRIVVGRHGAPGRSETARRRARLRIANGARGGRGVDLRLVEALIPPGSDRVRPDGPAAPRAGGRGRFPGPPGDR